MKTVTAACEESKSTIFLSSNAQFAIFGDVLVAVVSVVAQVWKVRLAYWTSIAPSTSTTNVACGLSFSRSQPDCEGFLPTPPVSPSSKSTPSLIHLAVVLCSEVIHGSCSGAEGLAGSTAPSVRPR